MVVERYCQVIAKDSATISVFWKVSHVLCLLTTAVCAFVANLNFLLIRETFGHRCIVFANLSFDEVNPYENVGPFTGNWSFHNAKTIWGKESYCISHKCTYQFSMLIAIIMMAFFIILPKGGQSQNRGVYTEAWKMIPWALIFSAIMSIATIVNYMVLKRGLRVFLEQIYNKLREEGISCEEDCDELLNVHTLIFNTEKIDISRSINILRITSYISMMGWNLLTVALIVRMIIGVDFRIVIYHLRPGVKELDTDSSLSSQSFSDGDDRIILNKMYELPEKERKSYSNEYESVESEL